MSSSDDTNTYYQMIQYLLNTVDKKAVERCVNSVIEYVREKDQKPDELLNFHDNTNALGEECYKYDLYEKSHKALSYDTWSPNDIGSGSIISRIVDAMAHTGNLVNRRFGVPEFLGKLNKAKPDQRDKYERVFYDLYCGEDEEKAFKDATECFGFKYPLIAFLFFIKDYERFLPTSPDSFDDCFQRMGIPFRMSHKCSWDNYCEFISIIKTTQQVLSKSGLCSHEVSLLDAHSTIWITQYKDYISWLRNRTNDINTPIAPRDIVKNKDGVECYICARCDYTFVKSSRCPECGQLVKKE